MSRPNEPLIDAERRLRYRWRLKPPAPSHGDVFQRLNEAYSTAAAIQREKTLRAIREKMRQSTDRRFALAMEDMISRLPPATYFWRIDEWCGIAQKIAQLDEEMFLLEAQREALRQIVLETHRETFERISKESPSPILSEAAQAPDE